MIRRIGYVGLTMALCLAMVGGLSLAPGCYNVPEPVCGFFCGASGACPDDYTCMADNRCHLNGAAATMCSSSDAGPIDSPDAPGDTPAEGINPPPTVVSTTPSPNATGVAISASVTATFSEAVTNVSGTTFVLTQSGNPVTGTVTYSSGTLTATFTPSAALLPSTAYSAQLSSAISDLQGAPLLSTSWTFTTAADTTAPMVVSTNPAANATGVGLTSTVQAIFTEPVANATMTTFTLKDNVTPITGTVTTSAINKSATFTPAAALPASTLLTATLTTAITDLAGNPLASAPVTWTFTTGADTVAPTLVMTTPASNATGVAVNSTVVARFDEAVANATTTTFTLMNGATAIPGTVTTSAVNKTATFTPTSQLPASTVLTATLTTGITDVAGNPLAAPATWTFTTGADMVAPTLVLTIPTTNATVVALISPVIAQFDEAVNATMATFTLKNGATAIPGTVTTNAGNKTATFTPTSTLPANTVLTATLTAGVADLAGNPLTGAPIIWSFTTAPDTTAPMLVSTTPSANATGVSITAPIVATFDEAVINATSTTFTVMAGVTPIAGTVTTNMVNKTATFTPSAQMPANTLLTITLTAGITDIVGNPLSSAPVTRTFTTGADTVAPSVVSTSPVNGATMVATSTTIAVTFDEPVNVNALTFTVSSGSAVSGFLNSSMGTRVWTFTPDLTFSAATLYTVTLSTGITDAASNPLAAPVTFSFTTQ